jgi:hypothetical protein
MTTPRKVVFAFLLLGTFGAAILSACAGQTLIDVNIDPTTGSGQIVVNPPPQQATAIPDTGGSAAGSSDMSQVALFAIIVILLLGVMAIVFSVARRPRREEE